MSFNNTLDKSIVFVKPDGTHELVDHVTEIKVTTKQKKASSIDGVPIVRETIEGYANFGSGNFIVTDEVFATLRYDDRFNSRMFKLGEYDECEDTYYVYSLIGVKV